jgi:hypothetical protein
MFSGPPLPLPADLPLNFLLAQIRNSETLGAWVRYYATELRVQNTTWRSGGQLLVSPDLGFLLRRCNRVALREGSAPVILDAETVIQWRALQVITGLPHLPGMERLVRQFPDIIRCGPVRLLIPIPVRSPEEVLAECLTNGIEVSESRVVYRRGY